MEDFMLVSINELRELGLVNIDYPGKLRETVSYHSRMSLSTIKRLMEVCKLTM